jgi:hypothetical protein
MARDADRAISRNATLCSGLRASPSSPRDESVRPADRTGIMTSDELTKFAQRYAKAWCVQNPKSVAAFFAENGSLSVNDGPPAVGRAAIAEEARGFRRTFPDMVVTMDDVSRDSDGTKFHWTLTGTNTGPGGTGKRVRISGYELWKIDNEAGGSRATSTGGPGSRPGRSAVGEQGGESINGGLIAESKGHFDSADYERQLKHEGA